MDYEFSSKEELYNRVRPALMAKYQEFVRFGYFYIKEVDIWNYLIDAKWRFSKDLMLVDIVDDIMKLDVRVLDNFVKSEIGEVRRNIKYVENYEVI